jgi:hypothetical protein
MEAKSDGVRYHCRSIFCQFSLAEDASDEANYGDCIVEVISCLEARYQQNWRRHKEVICSLRSERAAFSEQFIRGLINARCQKVLTDSFQNSILPHKKLG